MIWQLEPLTSWLWAKSEDPKRGQFKASWSSTLDLLDRELYQLDVRGAVAIRAFITTADLRRDGMLRAHARPSQPGVAISFAGKHGALTYPCDTYDHWQANVRAIALSLEALRAVDRHGVGGHGEQYAGWKAIESARTSHFATADEALSWVRDFIRKHDRIESLALSHPPTALRRAARIAHPDAGGDPADWERVDAARQMLGAAGQWRGREQ